MYFIDIEVNIKTDKIDDIGAINLKGDKFASKSISDFETFIKKSNYIAGHNIVKHDIKFLNKTNARKHLRSNKLVDTLYLSTLLFPERPYHALVKDDKLSYEYINNPLNDAINSKALFLDIVDRFNKTNIDIKDIYYGLLKDVDGYSGFFKYINYKRKVRNLEQLIKSKFYGKICANYELNDFIKSYPIELAFALALANTKSDNSLLPPWVLKSHPYVETILSKIRNNHCKENCSYCETVLNPIKALNKYFNYSSFRTFNGVNLQEQAVNAALENKSLITVFPTGGGKSLTFQLPALISGASTRALTVVITPLQSLMKDQIDNLESKNITNVATINGLLDPIQKANAINRVRDGSANILYIAPESLRSRTIEKLLINRQIARFVIDEAHCFSAWGHDFRVDYLYIADFIKNILSKKDNQIHIPISCFTATAKPSVINDIKGYFKTKLNLDMEVFETKNQRENLSYKVYSVKDNEDKYRMLRDLIAQHDEPTIIYASRRKTVEDIYVRLKHDNFSVTCFHGGMDNDEKVNQQNMFMNGSSNIMVATNAFGMGVDKDNVGCIIHYEISSSIENYLQESGRAGRDENINANCYILYNENDLDKSFELLNNSKLNIEEIQQIWRTIVNMTKVRHNISLSAQEFAKYAGWDSSKYNIQTKVTTAINALEQVGYLQRGSNSPRIFANSILADSVINGNLIIDKQSNLLETDKVLLKRILSTLISNKYRSKGSNDTPISFIDFISDDLGIVKKDVIRSVTTLREIGLLADNQDLVAHIKRDTAETASLKLFELVYKQVNFIIDYLDENPKSINLKSLNEDLNNNNIKTNLPSLKKTINYLDIVKKISMRKERLDQLSIKLNEKSDVIKADLPILFDVAEFILKTLHKRSFKKTEKDDENTVSFSIIELRDAYNSNISLFNYTATSDFIEDAIFFLQKNSILIIEGGFLVLYNPINITRIEQNTRKQYTISDYASLSNFYTLRKEQIHIVGEYATRMAKDTQDALLFVDDYFTMEYNQFIKKYFKGDRLNDLSQNMTPKKFNELFGKLSPEQLKVIKDKDNNRIAVAAGPGSGKTLLLVHKLASILYTEDIKTEQLLMLTFSRAAVSEFKHRLYNLIGNKAFYVNITTFHSYAFDILGKVGDLERSKNIITEATNQIILKDVDPFKVTKSVLVIDEAQDMNQEEFDLVKAIIAHNDDLRVIAVGDDDQNIFEFRGSDSKFFANIGKEQGIQYELTTNYRSKNNLVAFSNIFVNNIKNRLKVNPITSLDTSLGNIEVINYEGNDFINGIIKDVTNNNLDGSTCIVTWRNKDAEIIAGLLNNLGHKATLIQNNDNFKLYNLSELRIFYNKLKQLDSPIITNDNWEDTLEWFEGAFTTSTNYKVSQNALNSFKLTSGKILYLSDLYAFLIESNYNDFLIFEKITVSTFHKTKGKEFDNVYLLIDNNSYLKDSDLRVLYVGMTRAKSNLFIHTSSNIFNSIKVDNLKRYINTAEAKPLESISIDLSHKDVNLGFFKENQGLIKKLKAGMQLDISDDHLLLDGDRILRFSRKYQEEIATLKSNGFIITESYVNYVLYYYFKEDEKDFLIFLPKLVFKYNEVKS